MRFSLLLVVISFPFILCQNIYAGTSKGCVKNDNDAERLSCHNKILKTDQKAAKTEPTESKRKTGWIIRKAQSKIDNNIAYIMMLESDNIVDESAGDDGYGIVGIMCGKKTTKIIFEAGKYYLSDNGDYGRVIYRLDKEKAKATQMEVSSSKQSIGLLSGAKSIPFIKEMFGHNKMVVQITPYQKAPETMEFTIKDLEEAIKPLREACGW